MKKTLLTLFLWASSLILWANADTKPHNHAHHSHKSKIAFIENQGQWHENVLYKASIGGLNTVFLEKNTMTYVYFDAEDMAKMHDYSQASQAEKAAFCMKAHAYKVNFLNAQTPKITKGIDKRTEYHNYFLGNDSKKWARKVGLYDGVHYEHLYNGVHLSTYTANNKLKYDLIVEPNADISEIEMQYDGTDRMMIQNGRLVSYLSVETIIEQAPYAYQVIDGKVKQVACNYVLDEKNKTVSFDFPDGYDKNIQLIIDPEIVAATLSGTTGFSSNYGHCAAFDAQGNVLTGAISFDSDYPTNAGSFQTNYGGGGTDIAISKLNPTGTDLIYATFLGGNGGDYPHSLFADLNLNLHVYGSSDSNNYPTSNNAYATSLGGNVDIVVTVLTPDGSDIVGSTYMGGSAGDGRNNASSNYGDQYRGEVVADFFGNTYIASCTSSDDFPVTANAIQSTFLGGGGGFFGGEQDGVLFKLNEDLSELEWSTYLGSSGSDMCYGLRVDADYNVYVCGTAGGDDFPSVTGGYQETPNSNLDAYVLHISDDGSTILHSTFWGTNSDDWAFFIDIDNEDDVAIYGQTEGNIPITPDGIYSQAGSKQFIISFKPDLATLKYSTAVGGAGGLFNNFGLVPDAFMVDNCGYIYFSGYSAQANLETTSDAILNQGGFYVGVLEQNGMGLFYATYYTGDHVDGGTSRFDDNGIVYQAVCSGGGFQTNADAYAPNQSTGWDIGVFKIDFQVPSVNAVANAPNGSIGCTPLTIDFSNLGSTGTEFLWDFADGNTSNEDEPIHTFEEAGIFNVQLIASDPASCNQADTSYIKIVTSNNDEPIIHEVNICENEVAALAAPDVDDDVTYLWSDGSTEQNLNTLEAGTYWVQTSFTELANCFQVDSFYVIQISAAIDLGNDTLICGNQYTLDATLDGATYLWSNGSNDAIVNATEDGEYWVAVALGSCITTDTVNLTFQEPPTVDLGANTTICGGESITLDITTDGANYQWQDGSTNSTFIASEAGTYTVTVSFADNCLVVDSLVVSGGNPQVDLGDDVVICAGESYVLDATTSLTDLENVSFLWNDGATDSIRTVAQGGSYSVEVSINGCTATDEIVINNFAAFPPINLGEDQTLCQGETLTLALPELQEGVEIRWQDGSSAAEFLVTEAGTYTVELTTNCETVSDEIFVDYIALPNINNPILIQTAFSPNGDNVNDLLKPRLTGDISDYHFEVYNRWGNQVFATSDMDAGWDGFVENAETDIGVYAWWCKAKITDCKGTRDLFLKGNTTLIR